MTVMKKLVLALVCLATLCACQMEDVFVITNCSNFVSVIDGKMTDDSGGVATITESDVQESTWNKEGARWYVIYDVLNRNYDLKLKSVEPCTVVDSELLPEEVQPGGPIVPGENYLSAKYFNLRIAQYRKKGSDYPYSAKLYYTVKSGAQLQFRIVCDDNGENPVNMDESLLEQQIFSYSFSMDGIIDPEKQYTVEVIWDALSKDSDGKYVIKEYSGTL